MDTLKVKFIGHATCEIEMDGSRLVTDPVFSSSIFFIKRAVPLPIEPREISQPNVVLISHCHYDHLDVESFSYINSKVTIVMPEGTKDVLQKFINNPIIELGKWASHKFSDGLEVTAVPNKHRGGRLSGLRYTDSNGYLITKNNKTIYYCGDSSYGTHFKDIGAVKTIDVAILPISAYKPEWFMKTRHMDPKDAVEAFEALNAKHMIPIHWGTFKLSLEPINEPIEWLKKIIDNKGLSNKIHILKPGEAYSSASK
ncbi:MBL fold metallo-hydrolase [bacterium]|nr:MBL fold metallo-hydrolase [bacterium]